MFKEGRENCLLLKGFLTVKRGIIKLIAQFTSAVDDDCSSLLVVSNVKPQVFSSILTCHWNLFKLIQCPIYAKGISQIQERRILYLNFDLITYLWTQFHSPSLKSWNFFSSGILKHSNKLGLIRRLNQLAQWSKRQIGSGF